MTEIIRELLSLKQFVVFKELLILRIYNKIRDLENLHQIKELLSLVIFLLCSEITILQHRILKFYF